MGSAAIASTENNTASPADSRADRYCVSIDEYKAFRQDGFLVVRGLVPLEDIEELRQHTEDLMQGRLPEQTRQMQEQNTGAYSGVTVQPLDAPPAHLSPEEKAQHFLRIHMLHRRLALHERTMLHPRVLDVLEVLIGPDVLALQTMLILKPPGKPGQGWHQDSYYIPTQPDTLCGAWIAIDDADEINGGMWMAKGSNVEPVYPPADGNGFGDTQIANIPTVTGISDPDDEKNDLTRVADRYDQVVAAVRPGDVVFFGGHVLHRSKKNFSADRFRRSFVSHYCSARSFTRWCKDNAHPDFVAHAVDPITGSTNGSHILARGDTHLAFATPRFGTPCAATLPADVRREMSEQAEVVMGQMESGLMGAAPASAKD